MNGMPMDIAAARAACGVVVRRRARNFWFGLRMLPEPTRSSLFVVYAWMREADDIADEPGPDRTTRLTALERFQARTTAILEGRSGEPDDAALWVAFKDLADRHELDPEPFEAMIEGQRLDLDWTTCPDRPTLERFCRLVASTVGRICIRIWGHDGSPGIDEMASQRGIALQMTNILRDVREDHDRGRVYLPADELADANLDMESLLAWRRPASCRDFVLEQVARARGHYQAAASLETHLTSATRPTSWAMGEIYRSLLDRIASDPARIVRERVSLGVLRKTGIAWRARRGRTEHAT